MYLKWVSIIFLTVLILCAASDARAQNRRKAGRLFSEAYKLQSVDATKALDILNKCLQADSTFADAWGLSGDICTDLGNQEAAIYNYKKAVFYNPSYTTLFVSAALNEMKIGRYADAKSDAERFLSTTLNPTTPPISFIPNQSLAIQAKLLIQRADTAIAIMNHPLPVHLQNIDSGINTPADEYINTITADESTLIFTRKSRPTKNSPSIEHLFIARKDSAGWKIKPLILETSQRVNTGALCISPDGKTVWYTLCGASDGFGNCDLYVSQRRNNEWSRPANLGPVINTPAWESQPSISADGTTLYFASSRAGGIGNADIWMSKKGKDDSWGTPVNLGEPINTPQDEMCPFIHPDGNTLYFASNGHPGLGGIDLFMSRSDAHGKWQKPVNLGYPINTCADEISLLVNPAGDIAYISSTQKGGYGGFDIYHFTLPQALRPSPVTYVRGIVTDAENEMPLVANFELINLATTQTEIQETSSEDEGSFLVCLKPGNDYGLNVSKPGYLFYSQHFALTEIKEAGNPFIIHIKLQRIKSGSTTILNNIFFNTDSYALLDRSKSELERLVSFLKLNPTLKIKIGGHTDNQGDDKLNLILSENRAKAVVNYLINAGISPTRLSYKGYGETVPIDTNQTDEGRAKNRRTEFKIE